MWDYMWVWSIEIQVYNNELNIYIYTYSMCTNKLPWQHKQASMATMLQLIPCLSFTSWNSKSTHTTPLGGKWTLHLHSQCRHAGNLCNILLLLQRHLPTSMCIPYRSICCTSQNTKTVIQTFRQLTAAFFSECNRWINMSQPSHSVYIVICTPTNNTALVTKGHIPTTTCIATV